MRANRGRQVPFSGFEAACAMSEHRSTSNFARAASSLRRHGILLAVATIAAHSGGIHSEFVFDGTVWIRDFEPLRTLWPPRYLFDNTRPLVFLSWAVNYAIHGVQPFGYFVGNLLIHVMAAFTIYVTIREIFRSAPRIPRDATTLSPELVALLAAALWAVHPLQTQSVSYLYQRLESLTSLFYAATVFGFVRSQASNRPGVWRTFSIAACAMGMASKELMATAPLMVLVVDWLLYAETWRTPWRQRRWYYVGLCATWGILVGLMSSIADKYDDGGIGDVAGLTPAIYLSSQAGVLARYVGLWFWPVNQNLDYFYRPPETLLETWPWWALMSPLALLTMSGFARRQPWSLFGAWCFGILAPTSTVMPIFDLAFEHRVYLPSASMAVLSILVIERAMRRFVDPSNRATIVRWTCRLAGVAILAAGCVAHARSRVYRSEEIVWRDCFQKAPWNLRAAVNVTGIELRMRRDAEALRLAEQSLRIAKYHEQRVLARNEQRIDTERAWIAMAHNNYGLCLARAGQFDAANAAYEAALTWSPRLAEAQMNRGVLLARIRPAEAELCFKAALVEKPNYSEALGNLGLLYRKAGRLDEAEEQYLAAIRAKPSNAEAHNNLGSLVAQKGDLRRAQEHFQNAIAVNPSYDQARRNLESIRQMIEQNSRTSRSSADR